MHVPQFNFPNPSPQMVKMFPMFCLYMKCCGTIHLTELPAYIFSIIVYFLVWMHPNLPIESPIILYLRFGQTLDPNSDLADGEAQVLSNTARQNFWEHGTWAWRCQELIVDVALLPAPMWAFQPRPQLTFHLLGSTWNDSTLVTGMIFFWTNTRNPVDTNLIFKARKVQSPDCQ